jgi:hypothetical protein
MVRSEVVELAQAVQQVREPLDLPGLVVGLGWQLRRPDVGRGRDEWAIGDLFGTYHKLTDHLYFSTVVKIHGPDAGDHIDLLYNEFENDLDTLNSELVAVRGEPSAKLRYDDPPLLVPGEFDRANLWIYESAGVAAAFRHEDSDVPLRLSVILFATAG